MRRVPRTCVLGSLVLASCCSCIHCWFVLPRLRKKSASSSPALLVVAAAAAVVVSAAFSRVFATGRGRGRGRADMTEQRKGSRVGKSTSAETFLSQSRDCHVTSHACLQKVEAKRRTADEGKRRRRGRRVTERVRLGHCLKGQEQGKAVESQIKAQLRSGRGWCAALLWCATHRLS